MGAIILNETLFTYEVKNDVVLASWSDSLSAESAPFLESVKHLFNFVSERKLNRVFIDSGTPRGGTLTEDVMDLVENSIVNAQIERIALLESTDYHWDNNLLQFLKYMKSLLGLPFEVRLFSYKVQAFEWLGVGKV